MQDLNNSTNVGIVKIVRLLMTAIQAIIFEPIHTEQTKVIITSYEFGSVQ
jgi:hypothetical protein